MMRKRIHSALQLGIAPLIHFWLSDWSLTAVLVALIVLVFILYPLADLGGMGTALVDVVFGLVLISGVIDAVKHHLAVVLVTTLAVLVILFQSVKLALPGVGTTAVHAVSSLLFLGSLMAVLLFQTLRVGPVTLHRIQGAVAVYLLLGLMWAHGYEFVALHDPGSFQPESLLSGRSHLLPKFVYFSFATLTTIGYGDITPVHPLARSLAILEGLTGQLFPAILIARLVALELHSKKPRS